MRDKVKGILKFKTFLSIILVSMCLVYYGTKYYSQGELIFQRNQFLFFVIFSLIVFWIMGYLTYSMNQLKNQNKQLLELVGGQLLDLVDSISKEQLVNHSSLVGMNKNTRILILESLSNKSVKGEICNDNSSE